MAGVGTLIRPKLIDGVPVGDTSAAARAPAGGVFSHQHILTINAGFILIFSAADSPGVIEMVERLRTNRPAGAAADEAGAAFIFKEGIESAMEAEESARSLTMALAGRARNVAPATVSVSARQLSRNRA